MLGFFIETIYVRSIMLASNVKGLYSPFIIPRQSLAIKTIRFAYGTEKLKL